MVEFLINFGQTPLSLAMSTSPWVVPTMQTIHILSIAIIFTSVLLIAMRVLGYAWGGQSIRQTVDRFRPWAIAALIVLASTGIILILAEPMREVLAVSFWLKMVLLAVAIAISVRFLQVVRANPAYMDATVNPDPSSRAMTIATVAIWVAIIFLGRFIAYDPLIWGQLSPIAGI